VQQIRHKFKIQKVDKMEEKRQRTVELNGNREHEKFHEIF
jgi:hypothetical protein